MASRDKDTPTGPTRIGAILDELTSKQGENVRAISSSNMRLLHKAREIAEGDPFDQNLGFTTRILVQANLPHKNPGDDLRVWGRYNGHFSLSMQPYTYIAEDGKPHVVGYPYGIIPRLLLIYFCTYAVQKQTPMIDLGNSMAGFFKKAGIGEATGGRWGTIARFKDQVRRLLTCHITFTAQLAVGSQQGVRDKDGGIASESMLWWDPKDPAQPTLFDSWIELKPALYKEIMAHPVPLNMDAVLALKKSPLAVDLYTWLNYRVSYLQKETRIPWVSLQQQMGADYANCKDFKRRSKEALRKIHALWPELRIEDGTGGFHLKPCSPQVPRTKLL